MFRGIWNIGIPKDTLVKLIEAVDADCDGFVTIGEVRDLLKRYGKDAKRTLKPNIIQRRKS